jgi:uncharacterized protein
MPSLQNAQRVLTRRRFLAGAAITAASISLYSGELERHAIDTVRKTVFIQNLPTSFHGFTIAQLSDFHYRDFNEPYFIAHAVQAVNRLNPDMVALTGDFITAHRLPPSTAKVDRKVHYDDANGCAEILQGLTCPLRFCSLGNHDAIDPQAVMDALRANHLTPLSNEYFAIDHGGDRLWVAGLADAYYDIPNLATALPKRMANEPVVLLGHEPDFADTVAKYLPVDLMLGGHTHGGQIRIPLMPALFLPAMGLKYVNGLFHVGGGMQLYVNRGLGTMHLPFRFNCPPELTLLTLQPA